MTQSEIRPQPRTNTARELVSVLAQALLTVRMAPTLEQAKAAVHDTGIVVETLLANVDEQWQEAAELRVILARETAYIAAIEERDSTLVGELAEEQAANAQLHTLLADEQRARTVLQREVGVALGEFAEYFSKSLGLRGVGALPAVKGRYFAPRIVAMHALAIGIDQEGASVGAIAGRLDTDAAGDARVLEFPPVTTDAHRLVEQGAAR